MKKICYRAQDWMQVFNELGDVRICGWNVDCCVGNIFEKSIKDIYADKRAVAIRERHLNKDFQLCKLDACPFLSRGVDDNLVDYEEKEYPHELAIGFERVCNYACPSCGVHDCMINNNKNREEIEKKYDLIEKRIEEALPYIKRISAHGCGELFVSKRTLRLLSNWKPLAKKEECSAFLETNGSLFDEDHWKQIENLGQYDLSVSVTVLSFDEKVYQYLSGCKLPIAQIENNLRFMKKLREQGIINYLEIGNVVQEQNFRELPEYTRRCIEEFGADNVRLRPYEPWGAETLDVAWAKDIRIPDNPLHEEYLKVMENPIFKHKKCEDRSGGLTSEWTSKSPYIAELEDKKRLVDIVVNPNRVINLIQNSFDGDENIVIYGLEETGKILVKTLVEKGVHISYIISYQDCERTFMGVKVIPLCELDSNMENVKVIITPIVAKKTIEYELSIRDYKKMVRLQDLYAGICL